MQNFFKKILSIFAIAFTSIACTHLNLSADTTSSTSKHASQPALHYYDFNFTFSPFDTYKTDLLRTGLAPESIQTALNHSETDPILKRNQYEQLMLAVRQMSKENPFLPFAKQIFTGAELRDDYINILSHFINLDSERIASQPLDQLLLVLFNEVSQKETEFTTDRENLKPFFDDIQLHGFLSFKLYSSNQTEFLYFPRPIIRPNRKELTAFEVNPIFLAYLRQLQVENKKHLYINLMNRISPDSESIDSNALCQIAAQEAFRDTFYIITLDRNSSFFFQNEEWTDLSSATEFKEILKAQFLTSDRFYWPSFIKEFHLERMVDEVIEEVGTVYFPHNIELSQAERIGFIELAQLFLVEKIRELIAPNYMNASCKHSIDRGPGFFALRYLYEMSKDKPLSIEEKRYFIAMALTPSIVAHLRGVKAVRIERLAIAANLLLK